MQRKRVLLSLKTDGKGLLAGYKPVMVIAECQICRCWERCGPILKERYGESAIQDAVDSKVGDCHRYPKTVEKEQDDWCEEFRPEVEDENDQP